MSAKPRILIAGFQHETNTFSPLNAGLAEFKSGGGWPAMTLGQEVTTLFRPLNIPIGGFIRAAEHDAELIPVIWTNAEPSGPVTAEAFDYVCGLILDAIKQAGSLDGIYLDLHGAMVTEDCFDGEAELLRRTREVVGDRLPISVSLDFHANISRELFDRCDSLTIYRTYPHLDMDTTGERSWPLLKQMIETGVKPAKAFRQIDLLIPLSAQCTEFGPLNTLYGELAKPEEGISNRDIALGFPSADIPDAGPSIVVYGQISECVEAEADYQAARLSAIAPKLDNQLLNPADAVKRAMELTRNGGMVVLADVQDNSGAGALSDTTGLLTALIENGAEQTVLGAFWDPEAVEQARKAGQGAEFELKLGGRNGPLGAPPLSLRMKVERLTIGQFRCSGAMQRDVETDIGPCALLSIQDSDSELRILVSTQRHQAIDQELFRHVGIEPSRQRIVAVKSTVHYRADFAPQAKAVFRVDSPGYNPCILSKVKYTNLRSGVSIVGG